MTSIKRKMRPADRIQDGRLIELLLNQEPKVHELRCLVIAMNLIVPGQEGIEPEAMPGAKFVASAAWNAMEKVLQAWTEIPASFVAGIKAARERIVARKDDDRETFLRNRGFSKPDTAKIVAAALAEEGRPPVSIFDFVQGITALARSKPHQDARLELEGNARRVRLATRAAPHAGPAVKSEQHGDGGRRGKPGRETGKSRDCGLPRIFGRNRA